MRDAYRFRLVLVLEPFYSALASVLFFYLSYPLSDYQYVSSAIEARDVVDYTKMQDTEEAV
jgi:hypothetical protein